jgi:hypothetical protein
MFKVEAAFHAVSEQILSNIGGGLDHWMKLGVEDKLLQFANYLSNMRKDLKLGGLVGIYVIFKNNEAQIGDDIKRVVLEELFNTITDYDN